MEVRPYEGNEKYIFLSYAHKDLQDVLELAGRLQEQNYNVWFDEGIDPGTEWDENIAEHIEKSSYFIAYVTENFVESQNCRDEISYARRLKKDCLVIYGDDTELPGGMKMRLGVLQSVYRNKYWDTEDFYKKIVRARGLDSCRSTPAEDPAEPDASAGSADTESSGKLSGRKRLPLLAVLVMAAVLLITGYKAFYAKPDLEAVYKNDPERVEYLVMEEESYKSEIIGNDVCITFFLDDDQIEKYSDNMDLIFHSAVHWKSDDIIKQIELAEFISGCKNIRFILIAAYEGEELYREIWTDEGRVE